MDKSNGAFPPITAIPFIPPPSIVLTSTIRENINRYFAIEVVPDDEIIQAFIDSYYEPHIDVAYALLIHIPDTIKEKKMKKEPINKTEYNEAIRRYKIGDNAKDLNIIEIIGRIQNVLNSI